MVVNIPIVTLDKIYISPDDNNIYFLDCTRVNGSNELIARNSESVEEQIENISKNLTSKKIILADDVIFTGSVLKKIIGMFKKYNIEVVGVISSICTEEAFNYFNEKLDGGVKTNYILENKVIDQVCERDFYFGIAGSGILIKTDEGFSKAPYFKPFGDPCERASIPREYETYFSNGCSERSLYLWENIDKNKGRYSLISELPEKIINISKDDYVVKTLRKVVNK